mgnify:CR=1 FL=1
MKKKINRSFFGTIVLVIILLLFGAFMALPILYIFFNAFKPLEEIFIFPPRIYVRHPTVENFGQMANIVSNMWVPFSRYLFNSILVTTVGTVGYLIIATLAAYPLAKHNFRGKKLINTLITTALMFTGAVTALPKYIVMSTLGFIDSYYALILPTFADTMGVFLCVQFLETVPDTLLEAGKIDGAGEWRIFFNIVIPNIKPVIFTILIFQFQAVWNQIAADYIYREELKTLPMVLSQIATAGISRAGVGSAAALILIIPPIFVFILSQSNVMETMAHSGMKD